MSKELKDAKKLTKSEVAALITKGKAVLNQDSKMFFKNNTIHLPVTMKQFEDLTNEILQALNMLSDPHFLEADYLAQVLMSAIHAMDHKIGTTKKSDLFESCVNRISCHVTYHAVEEIQKRIKAQAAATGEELKTIETPMTDTPAPDTTQEKAPEAPTNEEAN